MTRTYGSDDQVRKIKDSLDIVDVVSSYVELSRRGANYWALCPFHAEKTSSFSVNRSGQFYHCFGCKKSGDVIDFVMALEGMTFIEALELLGDRCGIQVERMAPEQRTKGDKNRLFTVLEAAAKRFEGNLQDTRGVEARNYLTRRRITPEVVSRFRIGCATAGWHDLKELLIGSGFSDEELLEAGLIKRSDRGGTYDLFRNRLMLPIFDIQGRVVGFGARVLDDSLPKYINSPDTRIFQKSRLFYGLHLARRAVTTERSCVVVAGYTDVIMAHGRGVANTIATLGTALTEDHARLLKRMVERVILLFDGDEAGEIAAGRGIEILLRHDLDVTVVLLQEKMDPFDYFSLHGAEDFQALVAAEGRDFFDFTTEYHIKRYDLSTVGGKSKLARVLLKLVYCHQDLIKRDLLIKKIAETIGVSDEVLRKEFSNMAISQPLRGQKPPPVDLAAANRITITTLEDDLILGLLRRPELAAVHLDALQSMETDDGEGAEIIETLVELQISGRMEVRELLTVLHGKPEACQRVIALASDPRKTDPERLVSLALDSMKDRRFRMDYEQMKEKSKALLKEAGSAEADQFLKEIGRQLKLRKGAKEKSEDR